MTQLHLYTTSGCHLCEEAEKMLEALGCHWQAIEISDDEQLVDEYGLRIPVIKMTSTKMTVAQRPNQPDKELGWPFSKVELQQWLDDFN